MIDVTPFMTLYDSIILVYSFLLLYFLYFFRRGMPEELHTLSLSLPLPISSLYHSLFIYSFFYNNLQFPSSVSDDALLS